MIELSKVLASSCTLSFIGTLTNYFHPLVLQTQHSSCIRVNFNFKVEMPNAFSTNK